MSLKLKSLFAATMLLLAGSAAAGGSPFSAPESAVQDARSGAIYVSNIAGDSMARDGNGYITRLDATGAVTEASFLPLPGSPRLNAPKGLALADGVLWVADLDRVVGFELKTRRQRQAVDLRPFEVKFANDLTFGPDGRLWVSDTYGDQVLAITLGMGKEKGKIERVLQGATGGANGLFFTPEGDLLVASSPIDFQTPAHLHRFKLLAGKPFRIPVQVTRQAGIYDGVAAHAGQLWLSDWTRGAVLRLDAEGKATEVVTGLKGPADFALTADGTQLIVVDLGSGTVKLHPLQPVTRR